MFNRGRVRRGEAGHARRVRGVFDGSGAAEIPIIPYAEQCAHYVDTDKPDLTQSNRDAGRYQSFPWSGLQGFARPFVNRAPPRRYGRSAARRGSRAGCDTPENFWEQGEGHRGWDTFFGRKWIASAD